VLTYVFCILIFFVHVMEIHIELCSLLAVDHCTVKDTKSGIPYVANFPM